MISSSLSKWLLQVVVGRDDVFRVIDLLNELYDVEVTFALRLADDEDRVTFADPTPRSKAQLNVTRNNEH